MWESGMCWILANAEKLGGLATVGTLIVAVIALGFAYQQIQETRDVQSQATAKDVYRDYLNLAFENPAYSNPTKFIKAPNGGGWNNKEEWIKDEKYRWFVAFMLN